MTQKISDIELTEESIESLIYEIRGQRVMLDFDLARIYGYSTKAFNQQVKNNIDKFPKDFMFQLTADEVKCISRCKNFTLNKSETETEKFLWSKNLTLDKQDKLMPRTVTTQKCQTEIDNPLWCKKFTLKKSENESEEISWSQNVTLNKSGNLRGQHIKYLPYAFTEQGIYMLMTVLKGELAVKQSKALIRLFKRMKDYIIENKGLIGYNASLINDKFLSYDKKFEDVDEKLKIVMDNFIDPSTYKSFLILDGQKIEADLAYQTIYSLAKQSIYIIDDWNFGSTGFC